MLRTLLACILLLISLGACASTQAIMPRVDIIDRPALNSDAQAELGDTIVEKGRLSTFEALSLENTLTWGDGIILKKFTISPGKLRANQQDAKAIYFLSDRMTSYDALLGTSQWPDGGLCIKHTEPNNPLLYIKAGACGMKPNVRPIVERTRVTDRDATGFRQELIYNGRSGDTIKFLYREFTNDYARPPFSQEVQYDLKDGMVIGFKGVRI